MAELQLHFLGQPRIRLGDRPILEISASKWMGLLAYLALHEEQFSRSQLEALFWGESAIEQAQGSLRVAIHTLNKQLGAPIQSTRKLVWFAAAPPVVVDVAQFRALIARGDAESLATAVSLYRGDFLAGIAIPDAPEFESWLRQEREQLRLEALTALEKLVTHYRKAGQPEAAMQTARRLLEIEPWRETAHRQLMLLLARSGDYNGAIRQYQQCRDLLAAELEMPPMPETEALYQRIVALRERPPRADLPASVELVGREPELAVLSDLLEDPACRLLAITGMGGIGKTSLALAVARRYARHFLDGVTFVSLADLETAALLDTTVAAALDISIPPNASPRETLRDQLRAQERLLILDNVEHLLPAVEAFVQALLAAAPDLKIMLTSQQKPRLQANVLTLAGLPLPSLLEETAVAPAATLFAQRARRSQPYFSLADNWPHVVALCHLLQGSPLGLELAAAQLEAIDCAELVARLQTVMEELAVDFHDMPERHRSLRALFAYSWRRLTAVEQETLAQLAAFRSGFTLEAARQIVGATRQTLETLVAKSLLIAGESRYAIAHPLVRRFALDYLPTETAVFARHARYYSQQVQAQEEGKLRLPALLADLDNIRAMWEYAVDRREVDLLGETAHGLARLYTTANLFAEGRELFAQAVAALAETAAPQENPIAWGLLLGRYAIFMLRAGELAEARHCLEQSVAALRDAGDEEALAFSLNLLGVIHIQSGSFETAVALLTDCAAIYRRLDKSALLLKPLVNLGSVEMRRGNYTTAIAHLQAALPLAKQLNDRRGLTHILNNLGANYVILGDLDAAYAHFAACLPLTEETDYRMVRTAVEQNLAEVCGKQGDWAQAVAHCEAGLAIATEIEDVVQTIGLQKVYALALHSQRERRRAWQLLQTATQTGWRIGALPALLDALTVAGQLWLAEGKTAVAVELLQAVIDHPAAEQQHAQEAQRLLLQAGALPGVNGEKRPFADLLEALLLKMAAQG